MDNKSSNSPDKAGTLTIVPKERARRLMGDGVLNWIEFDGLPGEPREVGLTTPAHVQFFLIVLPRPCLQLRGADNAPCTRRSVTGSRVKDVHYR